MAETSFKLAHEFAPGVYVGTVLVQAGNKVYWICQPGQALGEGDWELWTDGFADIVWVGDTPTVNKFSRSASNMANPVGCWTKQHVETFVKRKLAG